MNKRGQAVEQVLEAGKLLFYVLIALMLLAVGYAMWDIFMKEKPTDITRDRDSVIKQLSALQPDQRLEVVSRSNTAFTIQLLGTGNSKQDCKKMPCVCVIEQGKDKCAIMPKIGSDCSKICAKQGESLGKMTDAGNGKPVLICSKSNELHLGDAC
jgi:hypothetical protein